MKTFFALSFVMIVLLFVSCNNDDDGCIQSPGSHYGYNYDHVRFTIIDSLTKEPIFWDYDFEIYKDNSTEKISHLNNSEGEFELSFPRCYAPLGFNCSIRYTFKYENNEVDTLQLEYRISTINNCGANYADLIQILYDSQIAERYGSDNNYFFIEKSF